MNNVNTETTSIKLFATSDWRLVAKAARIEKYSDTGEGWMELRRQAGIIDKPLRPPY